MLEPKSAQYIRPMMRHLSKPFVRTYPVLNRLERRSAQPTRNVPFLDRGGRMSLLLVSVCLLRGRGDRFLFISVVTRGLLLGFFYVVQGYMGSLFAF
ncbi:hypothetical protein Lalb_Chr06g0166591 [Lupinus albus]|uniref:Transmembrane protein n=1 Tax=Lupinus albus TaxID=3870 RepID=A0A6A4QE63_LUPAL|nr:hypothetical protein Lalb_Chr06g0166591 [Lupinus albus]